MLAIYSATGIDKQKKKIDELSKVINESSITIAELNQHIQYLVNELKKEQHEPNVFKMDTGNP